MNPVIGDIVIIKRLKLDAVGDDRDPAIVNSVRMAGPFRRPGFVEPEGPSNDPSRAGLPLPAGLETGSGPLPTPVPPHASIPGVPPIDVQVALSNEIVVPAPVPPVTLGEVDATTYRAEEERISREGRQRDFEEEAYSERPGPLPPMKEGESRPVRPAKVLELTPPDAFINATMFPEGAQPRLVRNVAFFYSKEAALAFRGNDPPRAPANDPDKYLVAYPKENAGASDYDAEFKNSYPVGS